jgi:CheY-like chemotaxis protein
MPKTCNILIVDDRSVDRHLMRKMLESSGYKVQEAADGRQALETARLHKPDLIISDALMPVMDGFEFCRKVKGDKDLNHIPFIFYTATYTEEKDEELALKMGADKFIRKPAEPDKFIEIIQSVIRDMEKGKIKPGKAVLCPEKEVFKLYNERLVKKLEQKMLALEKEITERKRAEKERKKFEAQLHQVQKMEAIGTLAGGIAHDFNNVLYSIIGYTELTMDDVPEGSLAQKNLTEVLKGAMRAKDMVRQILAFSRKDDIQKKPVKIQPVVKEALKLLRSSIPTTIEIRQSIDENCGPVLAASTQIHQVVMNLATNAYQAMREKGGLLELTLMEEKIGSDDSNPDLHPGTYLKLTVSDTGHGMNSVVMKKIFDPYFSTKGPGEGTGMGLAVVHGIVKSHGGDIKVFSKLGEGTTFHVYLPLIEARPVEPKTVPAGPTPTGTEHILFVDDEEPIVRMIQQILERLGYQVTSRTSSVEALEAFKAKPDEYDLVITDMTMPNMTGIELAPRLREIRSDIPIIMCTGFSETIDEDRAKNMGILAYIMKPFLIDEIAKTIRKVLDERKEK